MEDVNGTKIEPQVDFATKCVNSVTDKPFLTNKKVYNSAVAEEGNHGYGIIEADFLFSFTNFVKPKKVIQIGCGVSTAIILEACRKINHNVRLICVEPFPSEYLKKLHSNGTIELIAERAQLVNIEELIYLEAGDLLFADSTHTVKDGSEVNKIILEVLPKLKKGVFVHLHDIYFPYDYQRNINDTVFFWSESTLLHSFLINNNQFTIKVSMSMLHYNAKELLQQLFPNYNPQSENDGIPINRPAEYHFPSATFLQVV